MNQLKTITAGTGVVIGFILTIIAIIIIGSIIGGLIGAGIATGYNIIFGTTFSVWKFALIGSIITIASGGANTTND